MRNMLVCVLLVCASGCAARQAQMAVQTSLTAMAEGVDSSALIVIERYPEAAAEARARIVTQVQAGALSATRALEAYDASVAGWNAALFSLEVARDVLRSGQAALDVWVDSGEVPGSWEGFCDDVEVAIVRVLDTFETCGLTPPEALRSAARYSADVCQLTANFFSPRGAR